jgi:hypothetical protein
VDSKRLGAKAWRQKFIGGRRSRAYELEEAQREEDRSSKDKGVVHAVGLF